MMNGQGKLLANSREQDRRIKFNSKSNLTVSKSTNLLLSFLCKLRNHRLELCHFRSKLLHFQRCRVILNVGPHSIARLDPSLGFEIHFVRQLLPFLNHVVILLASSTVLTNSVCRLRLQIGRHY